MSGRGRGLRGPSRVNRHPGPARARAARCRPGLPGETAPAVAASTGLDTDSAMTAAVIAFAASSWAGPMPGRWLGRQRLELSLSDHRLLGHVAHALRRAFEPGRVRR